MMTLERRIKVEHFNLTNSQPEVTFPANLLASDSPQISREGVGAGRVSFPKLDGKALYGLAGDFVRTIYPHTEADEAALLTQLLVGVGNVFGRSAHFMADGAKHYTNLYAVVVGKTSAAKGSAMARVREVLARLEDDWAATRIQSGLSSGEGLINAVDEATGMGDKRLLVIEPEFSSVLLVSKRPQNTLSAVIRNLWDSGSARTLTKSRPVSTTDAHLSLVGHITPEELESLLGTTDRANGYANRFLFACVKRSKELPDGGSLSEQDSTRLTERFREAVQFAQGVGEMSRDNEAAELWRSVYYKLVKDRPGEFGRVTARGRAQVLRLSCVYALLDVSSVVRREHLEAALALWQFCEDSAHYLFGSSGLSKEAQKLLGWLRDSEGMNKTIMFRKFSGKIRGDRLEAALDELKEAKLAMRENFKTAGRTEERWYAVVEESRTYELDGESSGERLNSSDSSDSIDRAA
jgi:hypothetical protein